MRPHRAFEERPSFDRLWGLLPQGKKGGAPGADFSFASSEFKTLGAFFCNFATLSFLGRQPGVAHGQPCAPVPDLVGSRFPSHTISGRGFNLFKPLRRHFRATPFCRQRRNTSVQKIDDRLDDLRRGGDAITNIELRRSFGKKFVERLGSYATFRAAAQTVPELPKPFPLAGERSIAQR